MNIKRLEQTLIDINIFGASEKGITRLAYTDDWKKAIKHFIHLCNSENMIVRIDPCGNVIARREGRFPHLPAVALGSHLDTVCQGGRYDGTVGIVAALEVVRSLNEKNILTDHPIEIICFACEESSRFGFATLGSKAMAGMLNGISIERLKDKHGVTLQEAFAQCSLDFSRIDESKRKSKELKVFFELHVEQGPVLEMSNKQIGIVTDIAAPTRLLVNIQGKASHSGTTPIEYRKDALVGAAEIILAVERFAIEEEKMGTVATVGTCEVKPGAINVVPGSTEMKIDIRGTSVTSKESLLQKLYSLFEELNERRGLTVTYQIIENEQPVRLHPEVIRSFVRRCEERNISYLMMSSGAGHDAMNMATICPTGLIFVPSKNGLSHHPDEFTEIEDIGVAVSLLEEEILKWSCNSFVIQE